MTKKQSAPIRRSVGSCARDYKYRFVHSLLGEIANFERVRNSNLKYKLKGSEANTICCQFVQSKPLDDLWSLLVVIHYALGTKLKSQEIRFCICRILFALGDNQTFKGTLANYRNMAQAMMKQQFQYSSTILLTYLKSRNCFFMIVGNSI